MPAMSPIAAVYDGQLVQVNDESRDYFGKDGVFDFKLTVRQPIHLFMVDYKAQKFYVLAADKSAAISQASANWPQEKVTGFYEHSEVTKLPLMIRGWGRDTF